MNDEENSQYVAKKDYNPYVKAVVRDSIKKKIIDALESTDVLSDAELYHILNGLAEIGWKTDDGTWRKLT